MRKFSDLKMSDVDKFWDINPYLSEFGLSKRHTKRMRITGKYIFAQIPFRIFEIDSFIPQKIYNVPRIILVCDLYSHFLFGGIPKSGRFEDIRQSLADIVYKIQQKQKKFPILMENPFMRWGGDQGSELVNKSISQYFQQQNINYYKVSSPYILNRIITSKVS